MVEDAGRVSISGGSVPCPGVPPCSTAPDSSEIEDLIARWQTQQDYRARDRLLAMHKHIIRRAASEAHRRYGLDFDDAFQEATLGFIHALDKFDPEGGASLATYAGHWFRHKLYLLRLNQRVVHRPVGHTQLRANIRRVATEIGDATPEAIAARIGVSINAINLATSSASRDESLNAPVSSSGEDDDAATWIDVLPDEAPNAEDALVLRDSIEKAIACLPERQAEAVRLWHYEELSMTEVAEALGVSRQAISLKIGRALERMRESLRSPALPGA